jgi:hypothetical protein
MSTRMKVIGNGPGAGRPLPARQGGWSTGIVARMPCTAGRAAAPRGSCLWGDCIAGQPADAIGIALPSHWR